MTEQEVAQVVEMTIEKLLGKHILKYNDKVILDMMGDRLKAHYIHPDQEIKDALEQLNYHEYIGILEMYYKDGNSLESIAEFYGVDFKTITRNKKQLCLKLYELLS